MREEADEQQMRHMAMRDVEEMVKTVESLQTDQSAVQLKDLFELNGLNVMSDYEYDHAMDEPALKQIRRRMYALFRSRFKEISKLRREVKSREHAGHYVTRGKREVYSTFFMP
mmetsp:Transcript_38976/g.51017  ORF Transcript_38976/g.51017 Transcript_38976/m.51017 type:complete len:113 (+) Transcript_38976:3-341(+)